MLLSSSPYSIDDGGTVMTGVAIAVQRLEEYSATEELLLFSCSRGRIPSFRPMLGLRRGEDLNLAYWDSTDVPPSHWA